MLGRWKLACLLSWTLLLATASAQSLGTTEISLVFPDGKRARSPSLPAGNSLTMKGGASPLDYTAFAWELLAFVTKEVLSDSRDEYPGSPIGSRLSASMPEGRSEFGRHCLTVVTGLGDALPFDVELAGSAVPLDDLWHAAGGAVAIRRLWSAFEDDAGDDRRSISLKPKVKTNKVALSLTFHW